MTPEQALKALKASDKSLVKKQLKDWQTVYDRMEVHMCRKISEKIMQARHHEPPEVYKERKQNYVAASTPIITAGISNISRILDESGGVAEPASEELIEYLGQALYEGMDWWTWLQNRVMPAMIHDPNGYILIYPWNFNEISQTEPAEPTAEIIYTPQIYYLDDSTLIAYSTTQKSLLREKSGGLVKAGKVYYYVTDEVFGIIEQVGDYNSPTWAFRGRDTEDGQSEPVLYPHGLGQLPIIKLRGEWNAQGYYESYFAGFCDYADELLRQFSDWQASLKNSTYPIRQVSVRKCDAPGCVKGQIIKDDGTSHTCQKCNGRGYLYPSGPHAILEKPIRNAGLEIQQPEEDLLKFISPDVTSVKYQQEAMELLMRKAEQSVGIVHIDEAQSGLAKEVDRELLYNLLKKIAPNLYNNICYRFLWLSERLINISSPQEPRVMAPVNFRTKTEAELVDALTNAINEGLPLTYTQELGRELVQKRFGGDESLKKQMEVVIALDKLAFVSPTNKALMLANNVISVRDWQINEVLPSVLANYIRDRKQDFMELPLDTVITQVDELLQAALPPTPTAGLITQNLD